MHTDPIADLLTRIRNAAKAHKETITCPYSKIKESILKVMKEKGFIEDVIVEKEGNHNVLAITLKENTNITLKRVSSPGQRIYIGKDELKEIKSGLGLSILSTSKGIMDNASAKKQNLGGELLCEIY